MIRLKEKAYYPVLLGVISLLLFGLILANGIQAVFVLIESPVSRFLNNSPVTLCIFAGLIQGACEEGGYYFIFSHQLKAAKGWKPPMLFAAGRIGLHFLYDSILIFSTYSAAKEMGIPFLVFAFFSGAMVGLTIMDYVASKGKHLRWLCGMAIILHAIVNGIIYAVELNLIAFNETQTSIFKMLFAAVVMGIGYIIYKRIGKQYNT